MKQRDFENKFVEDFEIILESEDYLISSSELISILTNYRQMLKGINVTLNKKYSIGYDLIDFDVVALEQGSFRIPIKIKKFSNTVAANAVGGIIAGLFLTGNNSVLVSTPTEEFEVEKKELMEYNDTKTAVVNIAKTTVQSDSISGLSLNYTKEDGSIENVRIEKTRLAPIASINTDLEPEVEKTLCKVRLVVVSPVLDDKKVQWRFRTQLGQDLSAKMDDDDFLEKMEKEHIAFGKHDVLYVQLETTITHNEEGGDKNIIFCEEGY